MRRILMIGLLFMSGCATQRHTTSMDALRHIEGVRREYYRTGGTDWSIDTLTVEEWVAKARGMLERRTREKRQRRMLLEFWGFRLY